MATEPSEKPAEAQSSISTLTPEHITQQQAIIDAAFENLDLYATSKRFRDKIDKEPGGCLDWSRRQFETLIIVCNEYALISWKIALCTNNVIVRDNALQIIAALSQIVQRYTISLGGIEAMISRRPQPPALRDVSDVQYRVLPSEDEWEAMFSDRS